jgi:hypothetical protein
MKVRSGTVPIVRALSALEQLHAELAGKLKENEGERARLVESMRHVEAVLKLLQPGYKATTISIRRRKTNPWFKRGTVLRHVLEVLRKAEAPLTPREITDRMIVGHGIANPDPAEVYKLSKSISAALLNHRSPAIVESLETGQRRWAVADRD